MDAPSGPGEPGRFRSPVLPSRPGPPTSRGAGLSLLLGAASVLFCWTGVAALVAVLALVLAARARREPGAGPVVTAAVALAAVGLLLSVLVGGLVIGALLRR